MRGGRWREEMGRGDGEGGGREGGDVEGGGERSGEERGGRRREEVFWSQRLRRTGELLGATLPDAELPGAPQCGVVGVSSESFFITRRCFGTWFTCMDEAPLVSTYIGFFETAQVCDFWLCGFSAAIVHVYYHGIGNSNSVMAMSTPRHS